LGKFCFPAETRRRRRRQNFLRGGGGGFRFFLFFQKIFLFFFKIFNFDFEINFCFFSHFFLAIKTLNYKANYSAIYLGCFINFVGKRFVIF
jgi:hypothetical protein